MIPAGNYEGKAIKGKVQLGETPTGTLQIAIDMELFDKGQSVGSMTTFLYFSDAAAVYSYERLRLMGWKGTGSEDIDRLDDIFEKRVPCQVTAPAPYKDLKDGTQKMGASKLEILTGGGGTVVLNKPLDANTFKARLRAIGGGGSGGGSAPTSGGGTAPPF
jgi:hypothetical protein